MEDVPPVLPVLPDFAMTCGPAEPATEASPEEAAIFARTGPGAAADGVTTSKGTDASVMRPVVPTDGGDPSIVIVLHRTECSRACPRYHLMLKGDETFIQRQRRSRIRAARRLPRVMPTSSQNRTRGRPLGHPRKLLLRLRGGATRAEYRDIVEVREEDCGVPCPTSR